MLWVRSGKDRTALTAYGKALGTKLFNFSMFYTKFVLFLGFLTINTIVPLCFGIFVCDHLFLFRNFDSTILHIEDYRLGSTKNILKHKK